MLEYENIMSSNDAMGKNKRTIHKTYKAKPTQSAKIIINNFIKHYTKSYTENAPQKINCDRQAAVAFECCYGPWSQALGKSLYSAHSCHAISNSDIGPTGLT